MSDIEMTVTYKINKDGDCKKCECMGITPMERYSFCIPFKFWLNFDMTQCPSCKDFLKKDEEKVYCEGCIWENQFYRSHETGAGCQRLNKTELDSNGAYCNNCKDKEVIE